MTDGLGMDGPAGPPRSPPWDHALRGGFWRRLFAFEVDLLLLFLLLAIFVVAGFIAARLGSASKGMSLLKQARVIIPLILPLAVVLGIVYFTFFHAAWGQTIGKMIFRVRVRAEKRPASHLSAGAAADSFLSRFGPARFSRVHLDGIHFQQTLLA